MEDDQRPTSRREESGWTTEEEYLAILWWSDFGRRLWASGIPEERRAGVSSDLIRLAMTDNEFRQHLVSDTPSVLADLGIRVRPGLSIRFVENSDTVIHAVLPTKLTLDEFNEMFGELDLVDSELTSEAATVGLSLFKDDFDVHWVGDNRDNGDKTRVRPDHEDWVGGDWHKEAVDTNRFDSA